MENRKRFGVDKPVQGDGRTHSKFKVQGSYKNYRNNNNRSESKPNIVFGVQSVTETLKSEKEIDKILIQREFGHAEVEKLAKDREIPVQRVPVEKLNRITGKNHQGIIAFVSSVNYAKISNVVADIFEKGETPLLLILDRITDVRNFGAIARTAECTGVHAIVVPMKGGAAINEDAMKTSSGALNYIPVCRENSLERVIEELQMSGIQIVTCTEKTEDTLYEPDYSIPTAIVMGSEEDGISEDIIRISNARAKIPMMGQIGSLNVSVATGVILYEVVRQRLKS
jgi:23S rRNA (guanosine2251-2'-O)-methyltransferase